MELKKQQLFMVGMIVMLLISGLSGCFEQSDTAVKHTITVGETVEVTMETIGSDGGTITFNKPGDLLDGLVIEIPEGAYNEDTPFEISYSPIEEHSMGDYFNPISPLITIENGGGYSEEIISVKIPANIPAEHFAMAFFYDEKTGGLEGIPTVDQDNNSLTFITRHFSEFVVTLLEIGELLFTDAHSGFYYGGDDWQFENTCTYVAPNGQCSGQCLSALYYYNEKKKLDGRSLYGRYDNNGDPNLKTPYFDKDDALGYKLCATVQELWKTDKAFQNWIHREETKNPWYTYCCFAYSLLLNKKPQLVTIARNDTEDAHAMIVYKKSYDKNTNAEFLYVSDPNFAYNAGFQNTERRINFSLDKEKFDAYVGGINPNDLGNKFPDIYYIGYSALMNTSEMGKLWDKFEDGKIGEGLFPEYSLQVVKSDNSTEEINTDKGYTTNRAKIKVKVNSSFEPQLLIYDDDYPYLGSEVGIIKGKEKILEIALNEGTNVIGFNVLGKKEGNWTWVGFDWVNIIRQEEEPPEMPTFTREDCECPGVNMNLTLPSYQSRMFGADFHNKGTYTWLRHEVWWYGDAELASQKFSESLDPTRGVSNIGYVQENVKQYISEGRDYEIIEEDFSETRASFIWRDDGGRFQGKRVYILKDVYKGSMWAEDFESENEILHAMNTLEDCIKAVIDDF